MRTHLVEFNDNELAAVIACCIEAKIVEDNSEEATDLTGAMFKPALDRAIAKLTTTAFAAVQQ